MSTYAERDPESIDCASPAEPIQPDEFETPALRNPDAKVWRYGFWWDKWELEAHEEYTNERGIRDL